MKLSSLFPTKFILVCAVVLFTSSLCRADDIADAKAAFATMLEYQKSDDPRSLDLFAPDCSVTLTLTDGVQTKTGAIPPEAFRDLLTKDIAKKQGNKDTYEDVKYVQEGTTIRVTSTVLFANNGKREPFSVLYERDKSGVLKVKAMHITNFVGSTSNAQ